MNFSIFCFVGWKFGRVINLAMNQERNMTRRNLLCAAFLPFCIAIQNANADGLFSKESVIGGAAGAVAGKLIGGDTKGALIGAAVGGILGSLLANLDEADKAKRNAAAASAAQAPVGQQVAWQGQNSQSAGSLTKTSEVYKKDGKDCMNVKETVTIKGKPQEVDGVQCMEGGQWIAQE